MKLWQIDHDIRMIEAARFEDGSLDESAAQQMDQLNLALEDKMLSIAKLMQEKRHQAALCAQAKNHAAKLEERYLKDYDWLAEYATRHCAGQRFQDAYVTVSWRKSTAVEIVEESAVPEEFCTYKPAEYRPSKTLLGDALKRGQIIPGARLVERQNIQIA